MQKMRTIRERKRALRTMIGARALLQKPSVEWQQGPPNIAHLSTAYSREHLLALVGQHCAVTAINRIALGRRYDPAGEYVLEQYHPDDLAQCMVIAEASQRHPPNFDGGTWETIPDWNDARGRTKEQVLDVFTAVVEKLYKSLPEKHRRGFQI